MTSPILLDFPVAFETERLLIRLPLPGDGAEMNAAVIESLARLQPWMPWAQHVPTPEESEANVRQAHAYFLQRTDLRLHLFLKGTHTLVGSSGLHRINWDVPSFEIGYWCRTRFEGQGYISEAVRAITRFAFEELHANRVEIRCDSRNARSRRVAERVGYRLEGVLRNAGIDVDGGLEDTLLFALIPAEYQQLHQARGGG